MTQDKTAQKIVQQLNDERRTPTRDMRRRAKLLQQSLNRLLKTLDELDEEQSANEIARKYDDATSTSEKSAGDIVRLYDGTNFTQEAVQLDAAILKYATMTRAYSVADEAVYDAEHESEN